MTSAISVNEFTFAVASTGRRVDLVTDKALRPQFRPYIEREAVDA